MPPLPPVAVLITGLGATGAHGVVEALRRNGDRPVRIIGADLVRDLAHRRMVDRFVQVPPRTSDEFLPFVEQIAREESADLVWPVPTAELEMFARESARFEALGCQVIVSRLPGLAIANNKARLCEHLKAGGFASAPLFQIVESFDAFLAACAALGYPEWPVCVKKPFSTGTQGFRILDPRADRLHLFLNTSPSSTVTTLDDLLPVLRLADPFPELLVQEYLPGDEFDVDVLAENGRTLAAIPRRNETMVRGMALTTHVLDRPELIEESAKIVASLGLSYVVNLSFRDAADGTPRMIEINPRIPGSILAPLAAGVNLPWLAVQCALGEPVHVPPVRWGTRLHRYWDAIVELPEERCA